jgi:hypothetical protein
MLLRRVPKSTIKRAFRTRFEISANTIEGYLGRAREAMLIDHSRGRLTHRAGSLAFCKSVLADAKVSVRDKVRAQERIDKLLGLEDKSN